MILAFLLVACGDECDGPFARCEGNVAANCTRRSINELMSRWALVRRDCGAASCRAPPDGASGEAFCALDDAPDPVCPAEFAGSPRASRCVDGAVVTWNGCWRVAETACGDGEVCADARSPGFDPDCPESALCSAIDGPDPLCGPHIATACADDRTIVHCQCNWRADAHPCADPGPRCVWLDVPGGLPQGACR